ncbi:MAG: hypothetical protein ACI4UZ_03445, partial [Candidatus Aphodocola sp.]
THFNHLIYNFKIYFNMNKKNIIIIYIFIILELLILFNSNIIIKSVNSSSLMFIKKIFPSLFPTMVIGNILIKSNVYLIIPKKIKAFLFKKFNFSNSTMELFIISLITGSPSSAMYINNYLNSGLINKKEAEALLCSTHFINPLFIVAGVGVGVFNNVKIGFVLFIMLFISTLIKIYLNKNNFKNSKKKIINIKNTNLITNITSSIKESINALLLIFGIVVIFNILVSLVSHILDLSELASCVINGLLEMTGGIIKLSNLNVNIYIKIFLAYYFLNFGGLCIQMQSMSMIDNKKIRYLKYLIFRLF